MSRRYLKEISPQGRNILINMQKGFGLIGILIVVAIIAGIGAFAFDSLFPDKSPFTPSEEEKSAIDTAEQMKDTLEGKSNETTQISGTMEDETANWKTYEIPGWGVTVKHPLSSFVIRSEGTYEDVKLFQGYGFVIFSNYENPNYNDLSSDYWQLQVSLYPKQISKDEIIPLSFGPLLERIIGDRMFFGLYRKYEPALSLWTSGWHGYWNDQSKNVAIYASFPPSELLNESTSESIIKSIMFTSQFDEIVKKISTVQYIRFANVPSGLVLQKGTEFTIRWTYHRVEDLPVSIYLVDPTGKRLGNVICCYANSGKGSISWIVGKYTPYANAAELEAPPGIGYSFEIQLGSKDDDGIASYRSNTFSISN